MRVVEELDMRFALFNIWNNNTDENHEPILIRSHRCKYLAQLEEEKNICWFTSVKEIVSFLLHNDC